MKASVPDPAPCRYAIRAVPPATRAWVFARRQYGRAISAVATPPRAICCGTRWTAFPAAAAHHCGTNSTSLRRDQPARSPLLRCRDPSRAGPDAGTPAQTAAARRAIDDLIAEHRAYVARAGSARCRIGADRRGARFLGCGYRRIARERRARVTRGGENLIFAV